MLLQVLIFLITLVNVVENFANVLVLQTFAVWDFKPASFKESSSPAATACKRKKEKVPSEVMEKLGPPCL